MAYRSTDTFDNKGAEDLAKVLLDYVLKRATKGKDFGEVRAARVILSVLIEAMPDGFQIDDKDYFEVNNNVAAAFAKLKVNRNNAEVMRDFTRELNEEALDFEQALEVAKAFERGEELVEEDEEDEEDDEDEDDDDACE